MRPSPVTRRALVCGAAGAFAALGANDRLRIAIVGPGARGTGLLREFFREAARANAEIVAVCDLWTRRQDQAAALVKEQTGREPRKVQHLEQVFSMRDVDGVIIATPDHAHSAQLVQALQAGKDVYIEKPLGVHLPELKRAYRAARVSTQVVQVGTQGLSTGQYQAAAAFLRSGRLGRVNRVQHHAAWMGQVWRPVPAVNQIRSEETDWKAWLMGHADRKFDPKLYFEFRVYREFSNGLADQWLSHALAFVNHAMDDYFPRSVTASSGVFLYQDGRENPDTFEATYVFPKGFIYSWSAMFGNDYPGHTRVFGENGTIESAQGGFRVKPIGGRRLPTKITQEIALEPINPTSHVRNWLECMRWRRAPNADIRSGYAASVGAIMAQQADIAGKRLYWDPANEEIVDHAV